LAPSDFVNINSSSSSSSSVHRNPMWQRLPPELSCSCTAYYCNPCTGEVRAANLDDQRDADFSPFGGLLCDQMGIGKVGAGCRSRFVVAVRLLIAVCSKFLIPAFATDSAVHCPHHKQLPPRPSPPQLRRPPLPASSAAAHCPAPHPSPVLPRAAVPLRLRHVFKRTAEPSP
jgi:hypothetical protein